MAVDTNTAERWAEEDAQNGAEPEAGGLVEPTFHLTLTGPEVNLIHQVLVETRFAEAEAKFVAASAQQKIEQLAHQNGQPE